MRCMGLVLICEVALYNARPACFVLISASAVCFLCVIFEKYSYRPVPPPFMGLLRCEPGRGQPVSHATGDVLGI